jgi:hypothetical protein
VAPIAGNVAAAQTGATNCVAAADAGSHKPAPGHIHRHRDSCLLCQFFCDGVAPVEVRPVSLAVAPVHWRPLAWTTTVRELSRAPRDFSHQARAPPRFS